MAYLFMWYVVFWCINKVKMENKTKLFVFIIISIGLFFIFDDGLKAEQSLSFPCGIGFGCVCILSGVI